MKAKKKRLYEKLPNHYKVRSASLAAMGFDSYADYLASDIWANVKQQVLEKAAGRCAACQKPAYTVHHISYTVPALTGKDDSQLVAICRGCHQAIEFAGTKKLTDANTVFKFLQRRTAKFQNDPKQHRFHKSRKPKCRACGRAPNVLGRDGICLGCFKRHGPKVHQIAADKDREAMT